MDRSTHPAFELIRHHPIETLNLEFQEYRHLATGARHYHLACDEANNAFCVTFLTVPEDSTGVAHVLEHTSLCGSEHFPVRDPFFMMLRRSINTFMNAMTSSDWTAYPFASQNRKDFDNLLQIYLDAVFFPSLNPLDFSQEGIRVEFEQADDPASKLVYKGVVFNEMKGAMSAPARVLSEKMDALLYPSTTYHHNSGGNPEKIPDLTYEQLKAFHERHYHPSNAVFMTFGNFPVGEHHAHIEEWALHRFEAQDVSGLRVPDERRYTAPVTAEGVYALEGDEDTARKSHILLGWLVGKVADPADFINMQILSGVLLDNSSSPLLHALETTDLGTAPSPLSGMDDSARETAFCAGVEGSDPENAQAVEDLVLGVLADVAENGVPVEQVESILHQIELHQRELTGGSMPHGLRLIMRMLMPSLHGGDPLAFLDLDAILEQARNDIQDPDFIKRLARELLLDNPHRVRLTLSPDTGLARRQAAAEAERLSRMQAGLTDEDRHRILELANELRQRQSEADNPEVLPRVGIEDIPLQRPIPAGEEISIAGLPAAWFATPTNGMVYQQIIIDLPELDADSTSLLGLLCDIATEVGCGDLDYQAAQARQAAVSGGISASLSVRAATGDVASTRGLFVLGGKALLRNHDKLTELLYDTLFHGRFDEHERLRELIAQFRASEEMAMTDRGHMLAMTAARAGMSPAATLSHHWNGLAGLQSLKELDSGLDDAERLDAFAQKLHRIRDILLSCPRRLLIVGEQAKQELIQKSVEDRWLHPDRAVNGNAPFSPGIEPGEAGQGWAINTQVNFCAKAYPAVAADHPDAPALMVLGPYLRNGFLHTAIREKGGAYGSGAGYSADAGAFHFFSYRDPRLAGSLDDFDAAVRWLLEEKQEARFLEEAILNVIGSIDNPGSPAGEAIGTFIESLHGRTAEHRQAFRRSILEVTLDDLRRVTGAWLVPDKARIAVISNAETLKQNAVPGLSIHHL